MRSRRHGEDHDVDPFGVEIVGKSIKGFSHRHSVDLRTLIQNQRANDVNPEVGVEEQTADEFACFFRKTDKEDTGAEPSACQEVIIEDTPDEQEDGSDEEVDQ